MTTLSDIAAAIDLLDLSSVTVEVTDIDVPFGGVQVFGATDTPIQIVFFHGEPGPQGLQGLQGLQGEKGEAGTGDFVEKQPAFPTPTTNAQVVQCLQSAGLCA